MNKEFIIDNVSRLPAEDLYAAIKAGVVTFEELRATMRLPADKQQKIRELLAADEIRIREEEEAWNLALQESSAAGYDRYLRRYPNGKYASEARTRVEMLRQRGEMEKNNLLEDIRQNPSRYSLGRIKELLGIEHSPGGKKLSEEDLINSGVITRPALNLYLNPPEFLDTMYGWEDLDPLKSGRADIYFFGVPASGKTCLLAGLLHYLHSNALLRMDVHNMTGRKYADALLSLIGSNNIGFVPPSTKAEGMNYIGAEIRRNINGKEYLHPVNILEMSGELFINTYKYSSTSSSTSKTIGANKFLQNNNRKVIFLVIDYKETISPQLTQAMARQSLQLETILDLLEADGTLAKTDAMHIVLTKSDLLPGGASDLKAAENFINQEYRNLRQRVLDFKKQYKFKDASIIPYSLGNFMLDKVFEYNPKFSETVYSALASILIMPNKKLKLW